MNYHNNVIELAGLEHAERIGSILFQRAAQQQTAGDQLHGSTLPGQAGWHAGDR